MKIWLIIGIIALVAVLAVGGLFLTKNLAKAETGTANVISGTGCGCGENCACGCQGKCTEGSDCGCLKGEGCSAKTGGSCGCSK
jgi:uncharacterized membrane protein YqiK